MNGVFAFDMGGTFLKSACITEDRRIVGNTVMVPSCSEKGRDFILEAWEESFAALRDIAQKHDVAVTGIGISTPGPFDFERGIPLMSQKFAAIYGLDMTKLLREKSGLPDTVPFKFVHDANAFLMGEVLCGAAGGYQNCAGITLGTGLGFAAMVKGEILHNGYQTPYIALYKQPYQDGILEDFISTRGLCEAYQKLNGELAQRAFHGDGAALSVMERLGKVLGQHAAYLLSHTRTECLVVGGQISKDFSLFGDSLKAALAETVCLQKIVPARYPEKAALFGAAAQFYFR